jgi:hypothetical protein
MSPVRLEGPLPEPPPGSGPPDLPPVSLQWIGFLGGPMVWAVAFFVSYALVPTICQRGGLWILQVIPVVGFLLILGAGGVSWRNWTRLAGQGADPEKRVERGRFMALAGMVLSVGFGLLVVAQLIPTFAVHPCR